MRRLLKICLAAAVAALAALVGRRLLEQELEVAAPPPPERSNGATGVTRDELYRQAKELQVEGRSKMNKQQLQEAIDAATAAKTGGVS